MVRSSASRDARPRRAKRARDLASVALIALLSSSSGLAWGTTNQYIVLILRPMRRFVIVFVAALATSLGALSCGRHATQADCEVILDRMVVVKLKQKNITDTESVTKMQSELRKDAESDFPGCIGRRITDAAMECIKKAESQEAIVKCLR